jgi:hypothetical protein
VAKLLGMTDEIRSFIEANNDKLKTKSSPAAVQDGRGRRGMAGAEAGRSPCVHQGAVAPPHPSSLHLHLHPGSVLHLLEQTVESGFD